MGPYAAFVVFSVVDGCKTQIVYVLCGVLCFLALILLRRALIQTKVHT